MASSALGVAWADVPVADGDGVAPVADNNMAVGAVDCGVAKTKSAPIAIRRQGNANSGNVFRDGSTVTLSVLSVSGTGLSATVDTPATVTLPSDWATRPNNTLSSTVTSAVKVDSSVAGAGSGVVQYQATGVNTGGQPLTTTDSMTVTWTTGSCTPPDTTAPTSSGSAKNADGSSYAFGDWTKQAVDVTLDGADDANGSGLKEIRYTVDGSTPTATNGTVYTAAFRVSAEGATTVRWAGVDKAGNVEAPHTETVRIDTIAPQVSCDAADGEWHAENVSIACTATDGGSGLAAAGDAAFDLSTDVAAGAEAADASTGSRTVRDAAGNSATAGPVAGNKVDRKAPTFLCDDPATGWSGSDVTRSCTAQDGGSGLDPASDEEFGLTTDVAAGTETADAATGTKSLTDAVGNTTTAGPLGGNKVDKKGPAVACGTAPSFLLNQTPADVTGTATDGGSGPGTQSVSAAADTSSVGASKKVALRASDAVGNAGSEDCAYSVRYAFGGFLQPVDTKILNGMKAGSTAPIKWQLTDANGTSVSSLASVTGASSGVASCAASALVDPLEEYATGATSLRYDATSRQFIYSWQSPRKAGTCYVVKLAFADGTTQSATFQLK